MIKENVDGLGGRSLALCLIVAGGSGCGRRWNESYTGRSQLLMTSDPRRSN